MTTATSPTAKVSDGPVTSQDFGRYIRYFQDSHRAIMRWNSILANAPPSGITVKAPEGSDAEDTVLRKSDIAKYSQIYIQEMGDLKKIYANRKRKTNRTNSQLRSLFYVSDQLVAFYTKANLGPIDPETGKGKLADQISLITEKRMATSGILMSLFARYIDVNGLKTSSGRFTPDTRMKKAFATTNYRLNSVDMSKRKIPEGTPDEKIDDTKKKITLGKKSALDRVSERVDKNGKQMYDTKEGLLYTSMCTLNNFFRIPPVLLSREEREELISDTNVDSAKELQQILTFIKNHKRT
jgi:hypothetical protein